MKYIIEIKPEYKDSFKGLIILGAKDSDYFVDTLMVDDLEVLNSDYINEHFGDLQDTAYKKGLHDGESKCRYCNEYQRGLKDGKAVNDKGCEGCKWEGNGKDHSPCDYCCNCYSSQWAAKQTDDEIKVGDIIANNTEPKLKVWVTSFDEIGFCGTAITDFGTVDKGQLYTSCSPKGWHKIGHYDIASILEAMKK